MTMPSLSSRCTSFAAVIAIGMVVSLESTEGVLVVIATEVAMPHQLPPEFVSITIDISNVNKSGQPIFGLVVDSTTRIALAKGLSPAYVRIGGTAGDFTYYGGLPPTHGANSNSLCDYANNTDYAPASWSLGTHTVNTSAQCCEVCATLKECVVATVYEHTCYLKAAADTTGGSYTKVGVQSCVLPPWKTLPPSHTMEPYQWDGVREYATSVGWDVIFGLNAQYGFNRTASHLWDATNAEELAAYTASSGGAQVAAWELGNELDIHSHNQSTQGNKNFTAAMVAKDFAVLVKSNMSSSSLRQRPMLLGCDATNSAVSGGSKGKWFGEFVGNLTEMEVWIDGLTYHHYYKYEPLLQESALTDFFDHFLFTALNASVVHKQYCRAAKAAGVASAPLLILGETGGPLVPHSSGQVKDTFLTTLWTFDKLAISAVTGHSVVARHQWFVVMGRPKGGEDPDSSAMPGYWPMLSWKRLMGTRVLDVDGALTPGRTLRIYAFCSKLSPSDIVVLAININMTTTHPITFTNTTLSSLPRDEYRFTADEGLDSTQLQLNGKVLALQETAGGPSLPEFTPIHTNSSPPAISLPPLSVGIFVLRGANAPACVSEKI
eukprot:m.231481 g.231481  ORF g.231481 m.231481 type:complete len:605 (+) comp33601_c1_seq1:385-2199(+)